MFTDAYLRESEKSGSLVLYKESIVEDVEKLHNYAFIFVTLPDILWFIKERNIVYLVMAFRHIIPSKNNIEIIEVKDYML